MTRIGTSELDVAPLNLGGNVFGWTADEAESHRVLDAFVEAGGDFIDTADVYSAWSAGGAGISETIIGNWLAKTGKRDQVVIATKVASKADRLGLGAENIRKAVDESLQRLQTDRIDLYWAHQDDKNTPVAETLGAFDELVKAGKVRAIGASNFTGARLQESLDISKAEGFAAYVALQNHYNLVERTEYETGPREVVAANGVSMFPYYSLASGFLTGKYRPGQLADSQRAAGAAKYLDSPTGPKVLEALDTAALAHGVEVATVALAWLRQQPTVVAPIASARTVGQLPALMASIDLALSAEELAALDAASA